MKKFAWIFMALVVLALAISAYAADTPSIVLGEDITVKAGDTFTVTVSLQNNPGLVGVEVYIGYDSNVMSYVSATPGSNGFHMVFSPTAGANPTKVIGANLSLNDVTGDVQLGEITFKMADKVPAGKYDISVSSIGAYQGKDITPVTLEPDMVSVTVKGTTTGGGGTSSSHTPKDPKTVVKLTIGSSVGYIGKEEKTLDAAPVIKNDRTMLPVRFVAEAFGAEVKWDGETSTATIISAEGVVISITIGANTAKVGDKVIELDSPAYIDPASDRTYLPVRVVAEALGATVAWDGATSTATLSK